MIKFLKPKYAKCPICGSNANRLVEGDLSYYCSSYYNENEGFTQSDYCKRQVQLEKYYKNLEVELHLGYKRWRNEQD